MKYHGRGGPWLRRGLWREASGTTSGEFNSARARPCGDSRGTSDTRTYRECHRNRGRLLPPWRVCPWASAPSRGRDTGPAHRVLPRSRCAGFARPITWVPYRSRASRYLKTGTQPSERASPPPTVGRGTRAVPCLDEFRQQASTDENPYTVLELEHTVGTAPEPDYPSSPDVAPDGSLVTDEQDYDNETETEESHWGLVVRVILVAVIIISVIIGATLVI